MAQVGRKQARPGLHGGNYHLPSPCLVVCVRSGAQECRESEGEAMMCIDCNDGSTIILLGRQDVLDAAEIAREKGGCLKEREPSQNMREKYSL